MQFFKVKKHGINLKIYLIYILNVLTYGHYKI